MNSTEEEYGPAIWLNRVTILIHPSGGPCGVMVCFKAAKHERDIKTGWYTTVAEAIPDIEDWCKKTKEELAV